MIPSKDCSYKGEHSKFRVQRRLGCLGSGCLELRLELRPEHLWRTVVAPECLRPHAPQKKPKKLPFKGNTGSNIFEFGGGGGGGGQPMNPRNVQGLGTE